MHHKVAEYHRLEAERHPTNSTKGAKSPMDTADQAPPVSSPTAVPVVPATDDLDVAFDAEPPSAAATGVKVPSAAVAGGGAAKAITTPESSRALMRRKEVAAPQHAERGRVVRALRATAIAEAKQRGTWHSNPAVVKSRPGTENKKKTTHRV